MGVKGRMGRGPAGDGGGAGDGVGLADIVAVHFAQGVG